MEQSSPLWMEMLITSTEITVHINTTTNKNGNDYTDIGCYVLSVCLHYYQQQYTMERIMTTEFSI